MSRGNLITLSLVYVIVSICFFSCNNEEKEKGEKLLNQAEAIIINNESSNANRIRGVISSIKDYLIEYQSSKKYEKYEELKNTVEKLYYCLDFHETKDIEKKYEELLKKVFTDVNTAIKEQTSFLDKFTSEYASQLLVRQPHLKLYVERVNNIKEEFNSMKLFLDRNFADLASYNSEVIYNGEKFKNSKFTSVKESWDKISNDQRRVQATKDMNKMVENFEQYLRNDAERICNYNYQNAKVFGFEIDWNQPTQTISIGTSFQHDVYNAKVCEGVFRVYMKGALMGLNKGTVKISVKGMICVKVDENKTLIGVEYDNIDYKIIETTGQLL